MSTLILQSAGAAIGSVFGPIGAILGRAVGALAGNMIDQSILNSARPAARIWQPHGFPAPKKARRSTVFTAQCAYQAR